jgi:hypothetical protein
MVKMTQIIVSVCEHVAGSHVVLYIFNIHTELHDDDASNCC